MKTLKALKVTSILNGIFCFFCIASTVCYGIVQRQAATGKEWRTILSIATILTYGWIANPVALISFIVCILFFLTERKNPESRQLIGRKWVWIFVWPIITGIFWLTSAVLLVAFTGGV